MTDREPWSVSGIVYVLYVGNGGVTLLCASAPK